MLNVNEVWDEVQKVLQVKREFWEGKTKLKFDEYGRAKFGTLDVATNEVLENGSFAKIAPSFQIAMQKWFLDKRVVGINGKSSFMVVGVSRTVNFHLDEPCFLPSQYIFDSTMLADNSITFFILKEEFEFNTEHWGSQAREFIMDNSCKKLTMKLSKFLGEVYEIWKVETTYGKEHEANRKKTKQLRGEGFGYSDCQELVHLSQKNKSIEVHIPYFDYQAFTNGAVGEEVYITINPYDILTSSGGSCCGSNPTSFPSCWSVNFPSSDADDDDDGLFKDGCFSEPSTMIKCGMITNRAILYIPTSSTTKVGNHTFIGYKKRCNIWFADETSIFTELVYPSKKQEELEDMKNLITKHGFDIFSPSDGFEEFEYQDDEYNSFLSSFEDGRNNNDGARIFLDSVCLIDGKMSAMHTDRCDMGYDNVMNSPKKDSCCSECGNHYDENDLTEIRGDSFCERCRDEDYFYCEGCGRWEHNDNYYGLTENDSAICDHHARYYGYIMCDKCDCVTSNYHGLASEGITICESCYEDFGYSCDDCGNSGLMENVTVCHGHYHCEECANSHACDDCNDIIDGEEFALDGQTLCGCCYDARQEQEEEEEGEVA